MKKKVLIVLILIALLIGGVSVITSVQRSKRGSALTAYKAQLRAQGEKLNFEEAGYPFTLETNANLENFARLSDRLASVSDIPDILDYMQPSMPGKAVVSWASAKPCDVVSRSSTNVWRPTWEQLATDCENATAILAEIRAELERPPLRFGWNFTNLSATVPRNPYVQKRKAAQFLAADSILALHENQLARAQTNLHALTQLIQVHREDLPLVSAMIRIAISGLALPATWEALQAEGWDETALFRLQRDWEAVDLAEALETGFVGERMLGETNFKQIREAGGGQGRSIMGYSAPPSIRSFSDLRDSIQGAIVTAYWVNHMDEDEMFYLRHMTGQVEAARKLKANGNGVGLKAGFKERKLELERMVGSPLGKYRHLFSAVAIPNFQRAFDMAIQNEAQRRMTITVIALKRFHLKNGHYPAALSELAPQFIAAELVDPWSGKPFHYRLNADGGFMLYSVGEDGRDNGGDPTSVVPTNAPPSMWMGKDALWPAPVFPDAVVNK